MYDILIKDACLRGAGRRDVAILDGRIAAIEQGIGGDQAAKLIDAGGNLLVPPFVDSHFHLDSVLSMGQPRMNASGTLLEGIEIWGELKENLSKEAVLNRARRYCHWAIAQGIGAIRSHVDVSEQKLVCVEALLQLREEFKDYISIQLVAFPQDGFLRTVNGRELLLRALDMGVDVVGGIPHGESDREEGAESVRQLCEIAAERGLQVDMHCDETDDPDSRHIAELVEQTLMLGLQGRVTGSHLTSMHSMDNAYVESLLPRMKEAGVHAVPNPLINVTLQGRYDSYPKRRGLARIPEMIREGINVALGHDCVMDPWYGMGSGDMLEVASMASHVALMTRPEDFELLLDAVTFNGAAVLDLEGYGLELGNPANMVLLQASDPAEAIRLRAARLFVLREGRILAESVGRQSDVNGPSGSGIRVDFRG